VGCTCHERSTENFAIIRKIVPNLLKTQSQKQTTFKTTEGGLKQKLLHLFIQILMR
jgi:hypothetical protein